MLEGQLELLTRLVCDDGSQPFVNPQQAHAARRGAVGQGGRCGSVIDLYDVVCPEGAYEIYMDLYVCPERLRPVESAARRYAVIMDQGLTIVVPEKMVWERDGDWVTLWPLSGETLPAMVSGPAPGDAKAAAESAAKRLGAAINGPIKNAELGAGEVLIQGVSLAGYPAAAMSVSVTRGVGDTRRITTLIVASDGELSMDALGLLDQIASKMLPNDHHYLDYRDKLDAALAQQSDSSGSLRLFVERGGDFVFARPTGWTVTATEDRFQINDGPRERTFFCRHMASEQNAVDLVYGIRSTIGEFGRIPGVELKILHDESRANAHVTILRDHDRIYALYRRRAADPRQGLACTWVGSADRFIEGDGIMLFEAMAAAVQPAAALDQIK